MVFSDEINWTTFDFIIMGVLLLAFGIGIGIGINTVLINLSTKQSRIIALTLMAVLFLLVWMELAVGVFEGPLTRN
jgi:hypothetical protein